MIVLPACSDSAAGTTTTTPAPTTTTPAPTSTTTTTPATTTPTATPPSSTTSTTVPRAPAAPGSDSAISLIVDDATRVYRLVVPDSAGVDPAPLVLDLHGLTTSPLDHDALTGMTVAAAERGIVLAQPRGKDPGPFWSAEPGSPLSAADVAFLRALVDDVARRTAIDRNRVYAMGWSNGGGMAHRLGCDVADVFAAIGPVSGAHPLDGRCDATEGVAIVAVHGTDDDVVPFDGLGPLLPAIPDWAASWAERNACTSGPSERRITDDIVELSWTDCRNDADVALYVVEGGGHGWPGTPNPERAADTTSTISATELILDFFAAHPKRD